MASNAAPGQAGTVVRPNIVRRLLRNPMGLGSLVVILGTIAIAVFAQVLAPFDPNKADLAKVLIPPDGVNPLGADSAGRDILSRLIYGAQVTLLSGALAATVAIAIGLPTGLIAGYYGGRFDGAASWVVNVLLALPSLMVLLTVRAAAGPSAWLAMIVLGILFAPGFFRLTRTAVQSVRNELYVDAARVSGLSDRTIIARHILSVVRAPVVIQASMVAGLSISIQSALEFLGLGDPLVPTWGAMVGDGFRNLYQQPLNLLWPMLTLSTIIGAFVIFGNALRDALEDLEKVKAGGAQRAAYRDEPAPDAAAAAPVGDHLLSVVGLSLGYPQSDGTIKKVVDGVGFHVDRNEVLGIVGESGSGKSQTAFSILGLLPDNAIITGGSIRFDGTYTVEPGDDRVRQDRLTGLRGRRISYIPQEPMSNLDPAFTIGSQLTRPIVKVLGVSKDEARERAMALLASVGIPDPVRTMRAYPHEVSGGMAQRVLIAGAISCDPDLIIADEPTTALDVTVQAEVLDVIRELQGRLGLGVIVVTHNFGVVADICDRVVVMQRGRIVEQGPVRSILRSPAESYTKLLLASMLEGKEPRTQLIREQEAVAV